VKNRQPRIVCKRRIDNIIIIAHPANGRVWIKTGKYGIGE
jgi:hypothetical protein